MRATQSRPLAQRGREIRCIGDVTFVGKARLLREFDAPKCTILHHRRRSSQLQELIETKRDQLALDSLV